MVKVEPESPILNNAKQTSVELIKVDENSEIHYQGYCKLSVKINSKCLTVVPILENFKDIIGFAAPFKWKYIRQKNIIFVFGEFEHENFALIFNNLKKCQKVYNGIFKDREKDYVPRKLLHKHFINPFFENIAQNCLLRLKEVMEEWIEKHEGKEKEYYSKMLKGCEGNRNIDDTVNDNVKQETDSKSNGNRKRRFREIQNDVVDASHDTFDSEQNNLTEANTDKGAAVIEVPSKKQKKIVSNEYIQINDKSKFKIIHFKWQSSFRRKLLIFTSSEKTHCYEFIFYPMKNCYDHSCKKHGKGMKAYLVQDENGNDCVKLENKNHVCSPIQYDPERYVELKIVKKPDYEILENCSTQSKRMLIIFDPNDKSKCYEYSWSKSHMKFKCCGCTLKRKHSVVEIWHENTEAEYITVLSDEHVCEIRKYNPEKFNQTNKFVLSPNFEVQTKIRDGKEIKILIVFDENDRKLCYSYHYAHLTNMFHCNGCQPEKNVSAKTCQNADGEDYVILSNAEHICTLRTYVPLKEIILRPPNIKFMELTDEKYTSKVFIFDSNDKTLCYSFSQYSGENSKRYYCLGCKNGKTPSTNEKECKSVVTVYLYKDNEDEYYVKMMDGQKHKCKPQKYEPEIFQTKILKPKEDYILFQRDEKNKDSLGLVTYHPNDKKLCFNFYYYKKGNYFRCAACGRKKSTLTAKLQQESDGNEFLVITQKKHVCEPIKTSSIIKSDIMILEKSGLSFDEEPKNKKEKKIDESRIVRLPNFELQPNICGSPDKKLIVFKSDDRTLCYEYEFRNKQFRCKKCNTSAKVVEEDIVKYVIFSKDEHTCIPVKYENKIIESSDFMIFNKDDESKLMKLVVFTSSTKDKCHEYTFVQRFKWFQCCGCIALKKHVTAKLIKDVNGKECIKLSTNEHVCTPEKFVLEQFQPMIVPESGFVMFSNKKGKENSKLIIFDSEKEGFGYEYYLKRNNTFKCTPCNSKKKNVTAKLCEKENGEKYLELSAAEHICESIKYDLENESKKIFENFVLQHHKSGALNSRLTIFDENDKTRGYQYYFRGNNSFFCLGCKTKEKTTPVRLKSNEDGKQYIEFGKQEHCCVIQNFKEKNLIFNDFTFEENENELITNGPKLKRYKFKYDENLDAFCCVKCEEKKRIITATICKDKNGKEFVLLNFQHFCDTK